MKYIESGFTLIEMLIVITLLSIMSVGGIASFNSYTKTQTLNNAANDLVSVLQVAKTRAQSQVKDSRCDDAHQINYWYVEFLNSTSYQLAIQCVAPGPNYVAFQSKLYYLPTGVTFASAYGIAWYTVGTGTATYWTGNSPNTVGASSLVVQLTDGTNTKQISLYSDGRILQAFVLPNAHFYSASQTVNPTTTHRTLSGGIF